MRTEWPLFFAEGSPTASMSIGQTVLCFLSSWKENFCPGAMSWFSERKKNLWSVQGRWYPSAKPPSTDSSNGAPLLFVAYDCVQTPVMCYATHGAGLEVRLAALQGVLALWHRRWPVPAAVLRVFRKPVWESFARAPLLALAGCAKWATDAGIPCDGVVLADVESLFRHTHTHTQSHLQAMLRPPTSQRIVCGR